MASPRKKTETQQQAMVTATSQTTMMSKYTYPPRTKAARRFNVLTKAADIQKRRAIHQRKTVWFPLNPVSLVVIAKRAVQDDDGGAQGDTATTEPFCDVQDDDVFRTTVWTRPPSPATHEVYPMARVESRRRALRRFNVLTKSSIAKARMGIPAVARRDNFISKTTVYEFPLDPLNDVMIFSRQEERAIAVRTVP
jgi:hypothetical protein